MNRKTVLRILGIAMVLVLLLGLFSGCKPNPAEQGTPADGETPTEPVEENYPAGTLVFYPDGVARLYGKENVVKETYTGWETEQYTYQNTPWYATRNQILQVVIQEGVSPAYTDYWFAECDNLTDVNIPENMTNLGRGMFLSCKSLTSIHIPEGVTSISPALFQWCRGLTEVNIPDSVTSIGADAFNSCEKLTDITIPNGVASIGGHAFRGCTSLTGITIPKNVTSLGAYVFSDCENLASITILGQITQIKEFTFNDCYALTELTLPDSLTSIQSSAFFYCSGLKELTIPQSVTCLETGAFEFCIQLESVIYEGTVAQWNAIAASDWYDIGPLKSVQCSDGTVSLN